MPETRIVSILLHVGDWRTATNWYVQAFPETRRVFPPKDDYGHLEMHGVVLEIIDGDEKVSSGPAGSVVYWQVKDLDSEVVRLRGLGATLFRGPLVIDGGDRICQVKDPWGNCIGLRQRFQLA